MRKMLKGDAAIEKKPKLGAPKIAVKDPWDAIVYVGKLPPTWARVEAAKVFNTWCLKNPMSSTSSRQRQMRYPVNLPKRMGSHIGQSLSNPKSLLQVQKRMQCCVRSANHRLWSPKIQMRAPTNTQLWCRRLTRSWQTASEATMW